MITRFAKILKLLREEIKEWFENFLIKNPPGRTGKLLRWLYWSKRFHKHPLSLFISGGCTITSPENIYVGEKVNIMQNVTIGGRCCYIGAGAVMNRDIPSRSLAAGVPATIIKENYRN